ncbi:enoyl-CoA hydratase/isomerase family protein [Mycobacterium xenopi]|uniref:Enoyl-CoA hydratase n=1 Tax=Mycobacterium xenopi TaxID=1789 RepID=A0AAD1GYI1_MYCXE|nr:enoyl-CoA hydratase-related protein [Mycobacterium xenopi]MDA3639645.1 enoyl-CoA hydratase-related protein [Mycobacterium xenopi]MDA3657895.1 enoyl-CoA hydratase-related protein [Mycobacterium xenopi]MDA3663588.1 enoyl-CoA hydratase-related protein [Mycobacterium xenopi]ORX21158.1 enoyl-CoA hydratase [Mycobacterium xenopi]SPX79022.1 enoyl-CoA hydratase [Mycobacterium xenopi]
MQRPEHGTTDLGVVRYERDGAIARVVLNWPERANAQSSEMVSQVDACLDEARRDYGVKVVIIKGSGNGFCAGHIIAPDAYPEFAESQRHLSSNYLGSKELFLWPTLRFWEFPKPMIAQVHGYALGGGTYWALLPEITIASEDAYFQMPLVPGLGFPGGETMIEPWVFMNYKRAAEYLYTAQTLSADEAFRMGLVNRVVAPEDLEAVTETMAAQISRAPLSTLMATKTMLVRAWEQMGMRQHLQLSADLMSVMEHTSDAQALRADLQKNRRLPREQAARD